MMPFYDIDTNMLYLAGKGDGNVRYYEILADTPHVFDCDVYRSTVCARGMAWVRALYQRIDMLILYVHVKRAITLYCRCRIPYLVEH